MTSKVIHRLQAFSNAIRPTFVQHFTRFQLTMCSHGPSALAELLVYLVCYTLSTLYTILVDIANRSCSLFNDHMYVW